jgi:hypothetical protein
MKPSKSTASSSGKQLAGVHNAAESTRIQILNGSHRTLSDDAKHETVLVLPDYKVVMEVPRTAEGAQALYKTAVDPALGRVGAKTEGEPTELRSFPLPYSCVILLCKSSYAKVPQDGTASHMSIQAHIKSATTTARSPRQSWSMVRFPSPSVFLFPYDLTSVSLSRLHGRP